MLILSKSSPVVGVNPNSTQINSIVTVLVSNGPANPRDWVAFATVGSPVGTYVSWKYLNGSQSPPSVGVSSASFSMTAPGAVGSYEVRLFANDGFVLLASSPFSVTSTATNSPDGAFITTPGQFVYNNYGKWGLGAWEVDAPHYGGGPFYQATLNDQPVNFPFCQQIKIDFGGQAFACGGDETWWQYYKYSWTPNGSTSYLAPILPITGTAGDLPTQYMPPYAPSPDGTTIAGGTGTLTTQEGVFSFGTSIGSNWQFLLNGVQVGQNHVADQMQVNSHGRLFKHDTDHGWCAYTGYTEHFLSGSPSSGPIPVSFTYSGNTAEPLIYNLAPAGTPITLQGTGPLWTITPVMSDGSAFTGTISVPPNGLGDTPFVPSLSAGVASFVSRTNPISSSVHSSNNGQIVFTQNGVPCEAQYSMGLIDSAPPIGVSVIANPNPVFVGESVTVSAANVPSNQQNWIAVAAAGDPLSSYFSWSPVTGTQSVVLTVPGYSGAFEVRLFSGPTSYTLLASVNLVVQVQQPSGQPVNPINLSGTPYPIRYAHTSSGAAQTFAPTPTSGATFSSAGVFHSASGVVTLNTSGAGVPTGAVTLEYLIDGVPNNGMGPGSGPLVGPPATWLWDTTKVSDGTHHISVRIIDSIAPNRAYDVTPGSAIVLVNNAGGLLSTGPQVIPCAKPGGYSYSLPATYSAIHYGAAGTPSYNSGDPTHPHPYPANALFPLAANNIPPAFADSRYNGAPGSATDPALLRDASRWYTDPSSEPSWDEYEGSMMFCTTKGGGVFIKHATPQTGGYGFSDASYVDVIRQNYMDGTRLNSNQTPYSNFIETQEGDGFLGIEMQGRLSKQTWDGTITTLAGWARDRSVLSFDPQDYSVDEDNITRVLIGIFHAGLDDLGGANDLCYDPRDTRGPGGTSTVLYVACTLDHRIAQIDLSTTPPNVYLYAGQEDPGFVDASVATNATFNEPSSIQMSNGSQGPDPAGTMYLCDYKNHAIRKILPPAGPLVVGAPGGVVSTLIHQSSEPVSEATYANSLLQHPDTNAYSPLAQTTFANTYAHYPFCIRWDSTGKLILLEGNSFFFRAIDLTAGTVKRVGLFNLSNFPASNVNGPGWRWLDVDTAGACGPVDDIMVVAGTGWQRFSRAGEAFGWGGIVASLSEGSMIYTVFGGGGHYPWTIAFAKKTGRLIMNGIGTNTSRPSHIKQPTEPYTGDDFWRDAYWNGELTWDVGSVQSATIMVNGTRQISSMWPFGIRPSLHNQRGGKGHHYLGCFPTGFNSTEELFALPVGNPHLEPGDAANAGTLVAYIQAGMDGWIARPEITGNDMVDLVYFLKRDTHQGSLPTPFPRPAYSTDTIAPVIRDVMATRLSPTSIRISWTTDKRTIGFAAASSAQQVPLYNVYSPIEDVYSTSHTVTIIGLPSGISPIHFTIVSKDLPGNSSYIVDQIVI